MTAAPDLHIDNVVAYANFVYLEGRRSPGENIKSVTLSTDSDNAKRQLKIIRPWSY